LLCFASYRRPLGTDIQLRLGTAYRQLRLGTAGSCAWEPWRTLLCFASYLRTRPMITLCDLEASRAPIFPALLRTDVPSGLKTNINKAGQKTSGWRPGNLWRTYVGFSFVPCLPMLALTSWRPGP